VSDLGLALHPGYIGVFTRGEAPGAFKNGTRIRKVLFEKGDGHPIGALGTVLGSIRAPAEVRAQFPAAGPYFYFVEWDARPRVAVGVASAKIGEAST